MLVSDFKAAAVVIVLRLEQYMVFSDCIMSLRSSHPFSYLCHITTQMGECYICIGSSTLFRISDWGITSRSQMESLLQLCINQRIAVAIGLGSYAEANSITDSAKDA